ncbi:spinster family MFS transporter [Polymorphobacter sp.]|uniref:spinster family MFS transporter n=1 Tax=Polymorphobacter sp. TaxID=1909290 RepID=UPI003F716B94
MSGTVLPAGETIASRHRPDRPRDGDDHIVSRRYYILFCLTAAYCLNFVDRQIFSVLVPLIKAEFMLSDTQVGLLSGFAFVALYSILAVPIARFSDRSSPRGVIVAALLCWSAMTILTGLARSIPALVLCRIGVGVGEAGCTPPAHAIIARTFPQGQRSTAMSVYYFGATIGMAFAFLGGGWLGDAYGWRAAFMIVGIPGIVLAVLIRFTIPAMDHPVTPGGGSTSLPLHQTVRQLFACPSYRAVVLGSCFTCLAFIGSMQWAPSFFLRTFDMPMAQIGVGLAIAAGGMGGLGSLVGGVLADRLSARDMRWQLWICAAACFLAIPAGYATYLARDAMTAFVCLGATTFLVALTTGPTFSLAQTLAPVGGRAVASAVLLLSTNMLGMGVGPLLIGTASDHLEAATGTGSLHHAILIVLTAGSLLGGLIFLNGGRHLRADLAARPSADTGQSKDV